jgi:hypothetical protein
MDFLYAFITVLITIMTIALIAIPVCKFITFFILVLSKSKGDK